VSKIADLYLWCRLLERLAGWRITRWERREVRSTERARRQVNAPPVLERALQLAFAAMTGLTVIMSAGAFAESYRGLLLWAVHHQVPAPWGWIWPAFIDGFVIAGELALFVGMVLERRGWWRVWPWLSIIGGLSASVAGNVGHIGAAGWADRLTAAAPPAAAFIALTIALGTLKGVLIVRHAGAVPADVAAVLADVADIPPTMTDVARRAVAAGIHDTGTLAAITGLSERQVQRARSEVTGPPTPPPTSPRRPAHATSAPRLSSVGAP
jgi:hypothetical protein